MLQLSVTIINILLKKIYDVVFQYEILEEMVHDGYGVGRFFVAEAERASSERAKNSHIG